MSLNFCAKILSPNMSHYNTIKQPFIQEPHSTQSIILDPSSPSSQRQQTVITIQTFKNVRDKFIMSSCYLQNQQKMSCNYTFQMEDYLSFPQLSLAGQNSTPNSSQSIISDGFTQSTNLIVPQPIPKKENQIQKSKNAAKNITKAFVRYLRDVRGERDKKYKDLLRFIKNHKYNNKNLKTIAQKATFSSDFQSFCQGLAKEWVESCDIQDKEMHLKILNAFVNEDYEILKEHKKRTKKHFSL